MNSTGKSMPPAPSVLKDILIAEIKDQGLSVIEASARSGYSTKAIYRWLREGVESTGTCTNLILENNRLKKEFEQAYTLLGRATADMKRSKKLAILELVESGWRRKMAQASGYSYRFVSVPNGPGTVQ